jgi:hypothetical protein
MPNPVRCGISIGLIRDGGVRSAECRVQSAECRVQSAECRVQSPECRLAVRQQAEILHSASGPYSYRESVREFGSVIRPGCGDDQRRRGTVNR